MPPWEPIYALDWNHECFRFLPHRWDPVCSTDDWPLSALPAGEYHLFVTGDLRLGSLGHPWEESLCVFGDLLPAYLERKPDTLTTILRQPPSLPATGGTDS